MRIVERTGLEIRPHDCPVWHCQGSIPFMWRPKQCLNAVEGDFHVLDEENLPDMVVGSDQMPKVKMMQEAGRDQEGLERLLRHQGHAGNMHFFQCSFSFLFETDSFPARFPSWSRPSNLLTPAATPTYRAGRRSTDPLKDYPFALFSIPTHTAKKSNESASARSWRDVSASNHETAPLAPAPPHPRLVYQRPRSHEQKPQSGPTTVVKWQSTQADLVAHSLTSAQPLYSVARVTLLCISQILAAALVTELWFCYEALIFSQEERLRLGNGIAWLWKSLLAPLLPYIGFVVIHFPLMGNLYLWSQLLSGIVAGGGTCPRRTSPLR